MFKLAVYDQTGCFLSCEIFHTAALAFNTIPQQAFLTKNKSLSVGKNRFQHPKKRILIKV
jgi:hypothetical protein